MNKDKSRELTDKELMGIVGGKENFVRTGETGSEVIFFTLKTGDAGK